MKVQSKLGILMAALVAMISLTGRAYGTLVSVSFQDGVNAYAGTQDTFIYGQGPTTTQNGTELAVYERETATINDTRTLIQYNLSSITPATMVVTNASLTLTLKAWVTGTLGLVNSLYLIKAGDAGWTEAQATWNNLNQSTTTPWAGGPGLVAGTDYDPTPIATAATPGVAYGDGTQLTFTFNAAGLAAINDWLANPSDNYGFFLRQPSGSPPNGSQGLQQFYSSEAATIGFRPLLQLDGVIPEPSTVMLLGCGGILLWRRSRRSRS